MNIAVIGSGFVGQATGKGLKKHGHDITFVDVLAEKVEELKQAGFRAYLPQEYMKIKTDVTMLCVPTPTKGESITLDAIIQSTQAFAERLGRHPR